MIYGHPRSRQFWPSSIPEAWADRKGLVTGVTEQIEAQEEQDELGSAPDGQCSRRRRRQWEASKAVRSGPCVAQRRHACFREELAIGQILPCAGISVHGVREYACNRKSDPTDF